MKSLQQKYPVSPNQNLTLTIGITAHNESANIANLLTSILVQKESTFTLERIVIMDDGSTDGMEKTVKKITDKRIEYHRFLKRRGKSFRLNQLFHQLKSEILVLLDADVILLGTRTLDAIAQAFIDHEDAGLIGGDLLPQPAQTLVERAVRNYFLAQRFIRHKWHHGHTVHCAWGAILGIRKHIANQISVPANVCDDAFLYFMTKALHSRFYFERNAKISFRCPQTVEDQIRQGSRFIKNRRSLYRYFDRGYVDQEYHLPLMLKAEKWCLQILKNPIAYFVMKYMYIRCLIRIRNHKTLNPTWELATSSKQLVGV